ncbi:transmembrane protein, putative (macronuclear) [Tetrahymena thermophila SB210]|uniref:Transmembrane protein, putative n=1 Tax=Tetrahymena thermophila (strain SB210) TaxID=312017 RepID=W7X8B7_TETTS|nr:transmembrane protein, putative [Tetrahymena thermophila SB210]EWS72648.1 transmembrane protein, putative [Tetrahymena thermophila SB210]|eukprot:XP_012654816.1 transmembrane protein, putative [Tetrahymena thermophila SB210]
MVTIRSKRLNKFNLIKVSQEFVKDLQLISFISFFFLSDYWFLINDYPINFYFLFFLNLLFKLCLIDNFILHFLRFNIIEIVYQNLFYLLLVVMMVVIMQLISSLKENSFTKMICHNLTFLDSSQHLH